MHILLVDDIPDQVRCYGAVVRNLGHEVTMVDSVSDAKDLLEEGGFDALITDMSMPGETGYDLIFWIWAMKKDLPCLLHSMEQRHSTGHEWIDLESIHAKFSFVTFKQKQVSVDGKYIEEFLSSIETKR